uniref:Pectinesterase inhibitor domain-containing protein n=1 Tax=Leersia perrieri TaxID=77586 RepID=A0A0D9XR08_9ORYZ
MAAAAASRPPLLALTSLLLALAVAGAGTVESYTNPSSTASATGGDGGITGAVDEGSYNPAKLCDNALSPESCVEVLPMIPRIADTPPDYSALAVLLDGHAWTSLQAAAFIADQMRAYMKGQGAVVNECVATCETAVHVVKTVFAEFRPLPEVERLRRIHLALAGIFREGGADAPPAYVGGCPKGSIRNAAEGDVVAKFRYVFSVLDLFEVVLAKVFSNDVSTPTAPATAASSGDENCTPPPPAATAAASNVAGAYGGAKQ